MSAGKCLESRVESMNGCLTVGALCAPSLCRPPLMDVIGFLEVTHVHSQTCGTEQAHVQNVQQMWLMGGERQAGVWCYHCLTPAG